MADRGTLVVCGFAPASRGGHKKPKPNTETEITGTETEYTETELTGTNFGW